METQSALDILKTAILLEKRGKSFYETVAGTTPDADVKRIFEIMAGEEQSHIDFLSLHYLSFERTGGFDKSAGIPKADESIANLVLNPEISKRVSAAGFEAAAISAAIDMENRAIAVYSKRALDSTDVAESKLYSFLADWEKDHLRILHKLNEELKEKIWNENQFWPF